MCARAQSIRCPRMFTCSSRPVRNTITAARRSSATFLAASRGSGRRILDLGCLCGASTAAYCEQFPDAEVHALDTSAPALRYAHGLAEARGLAIHFSQQNAEATDYPDGYFDLVVSHALFHETSYSAFPKIMRECFRLLRPGGIMAHGEVPARAEVMSPWEYLRSSYEGFYNQEPFWNALTRVRLGRGGRGSGFRAGCAGISENHGQWPR